MKKLFITALALVALASCKKEEISQPVQNVKYEVDCKSCLVYVDDNYRPNQHFVVSGNFKYQFDNEVLDSVKLKVYVSVFHPEQRIKASITTNDGRKASFDKMLGISKDFTVNNPHEETIILQLKGNKQKH